MKGNIKIFLNDQLIQQVQNLITNSGLEWIAQRIGGSSSNPFTYIAVGTGLNQASTGDTQLQNEVDRILVNPEITGRDILYTAVFTEYTYDLGEFGLFDASANPSTMFARFCDGNIIINKPLNDQLKLEYRITV